jgi:hypothetical protein
MTLVFPLEKRSFQLSRRGPGSSIKSDSQPNTGDSIGIQSVPLRLCHKGALMFTLETKRFTFKAKKQQVDPSAEGSMESDEVAKSILF